MKAIKQLFTILLLGFSLLASYTMAHGSLEPKHGGVVKEAHDLVFELVREGSTTALYIRDHGKDVPTEDIVASMTILAGKDKSDATFIPSSETKMMTDMTIADGAKVLVRVSVGDHHSVTVRYSF